MRFPNRTKSKWDRPFSALEVRSLSEVCELSELRDAILHSSKVRIRLFPNFLASVCFACAFEAGKLADPFLLYQFLVGSFLFFIATLILNRYARTEEIAPSGELRTLFSGIDRLQLILLRSQLESAAKESQLPVRSGGLLILGYVWVYGPVHSASAWLSIAPAVALGLIYFLLLLIEQSIGHGAPWGRSAAILGTYLRERANSPNI